MPEKRRFKIERTEMHTRVWFIDAPDEDDALERYSDEEDDEERGFHSGHPTVTVTDITDGEQ